MVQLYYTVCFLQEGKTAEALDILKKAYSINKAEPLINAMLGSAYCQTGDVATALPYFNASLASDPFNSTNRLYAGYCLMNAGRYGEARNLFKKILEFAPENASAYYFIGATYDREGNKKEAAWYYKQFLSSTSPNDPLYETASIRLQQNQL